MVSALKALICAAMVGMAFIPDQYAQTHSDWATQLAAAITLLWIVYWTSQVIHFLKQP